MQSKHVLGAYLYYMVAGTGLEPVLSAFKVRRVTKLHYPAIWLTGEDSNLQSPH